jgi:hypothetical protein
MFSFTIKIDRPGMRGRVISRDERMSRLALYVLPAFFLMFLAILFFVWYLPETNGALIGVTLFLTSLIAVCTAMLSLARASLDKHATSVAATTRRPIAATNVQAISARKETPSARCDQMTTQCRAPSERADSLTRCIACPLSRLIHPVGGD